MNKTAVAQCDKTASFLPPTQGILRRKCACGNHTMAGGECGACGAKRLNLQRLAVGNQNEHSEVPPIVHEVLRSSGQSLDSTTRAFMESRFERDFSQVRVHTDEKAAESAGTVDALAYTVGRDLVFGAGQYQPQTHEGRRLLAHELTHVVQQNGATIHGELTVSQPQDKEEKEADWMAKTIMEIHESRPSETGNLSSTSNSEISPQLAVLARGLQLARAEHNVAAIELLQRSVNLVETQPSHPLLDRLPALAPSATGGECSTCMAHRLQRQRPGTHVEKRTRTQCINNALASAGIPWAVLFVLGGICGILGAVVTSPTGPGAAAGGVGAAALCIAGATGLGVGMIIGIITRCIKDPSVEWIFAEAETGGSSPEAGSEVATT